MARVYVSIGSNIERETHVRQGVKALTEFYAYLILSPVYESVAFGFEGDDFLNMVVGFDTDDDVFTVHKTLRDIEDRFQRDRKQPRFSSRTLDLDLLLYGNDILNEEGIKLPRPEIVENAFVLLPLADIAGEMLHPEMGRTMSDLWGAFDADDQKLWQIPFRW